MGEQEHLPDLVSESLEFRLVARVKWLFGLDDDAVLRTSSTEDDGRGDLGVLQEHSL